MKKNTKTVFSMAIGKVKKKGGKRGEITSYSHSIELEKNGQGHRERKKKKKNKCEGGVSFGEKSREGSPHRDGDELSESSRPSAKGRSRGLKKIKKCERNHRKSRCLLRRREC